MFDKVLVANRGEIAVRIIRTLKALEIASVAIYSSVERDSPHVHLADEAIQIGSGGSVRESYLLADDIIAAALSTGSQAIHPGYGLLSENAEFVRKVEAAGLVFIGPSAEAMDAMGSKISSRALMRAAGVPIVPGTTSALNSLADARVVSAEIGYPVAIKASGAGGGKGFRIAETEDELARAYEGASGEGERFFGDATVYVERYLKNPRHVEIQILCDTHGNSVHLFERDCSVQRRHQKLVEESPAPAIDDALREEIGQIGLAAAKAVGYTSAGTVEGLLVDGEYYFLEMNTRIQVEHSVTEMVTGVDIVAEQILIAAGQKLSFGQGDLRLNGHAIECRINAESASKNFVPSPGTVTEYHEPVGEHIRVDSGVENGSIVHPYYDPLLAKLIVWGTDRADATSRMLSALDDYRITGIRTLLPFHRRLLATEQWSAGETCKDLVEDRAWLRTVQDS
ncbi:acetyl-CoA carboxylase biotin carboxylase subunit [Rhodococcus fascians]|nr:acetyl-CoA carboxylase biotin carboxylase subunit [Rhodococcus fascians]MBY4238363.1 acetyl-CoA carboxylase biotin carboxylase subunit [Rhodococcus fascians]MBY4254256.1 acetyl-CoA carboxylase biotin carboxylase subunit [Rhodococcus fascians]MBY4269637.1 acetyl-CoA carboxylase biotin carboxylase subunit [Rhodococcus fascians]